MAIMRKECPSCGHITCVYSHHLNKPLVAALRQLVDFYEERRKPANLQKNLSLTKNQYNNFQKLQYFFLAQRAGSKGWVPTEEGIDFIRGRIRVGTTALTLNGEILPYHHGAWEGRNLVSKTVKELDVLSYKQPEAYKAEKSGPSAQPSFWG
jgi:hypothetical protein